MLTYEQAHELAINVNRRFDKGAEQRSIFGNDIFVSAACDGVLAAWAINGYFDEEGA